MNLFAASPQWLVWLLIGLLIAGAAQDAVQLKISNLITAAVFGTGVIAAVVSVPVATMWQNPLVFILVLAAGTIFFARGVLGGGDVKLLAAASLWTDLRTSAWLIVSVLLCGGVLAVGIVFARLVAPSHLQNGAAILRRGGGIPYGVAVAAGALLVIATSRASP